jgi:hypothetical protein
MLCYACAPASLQVAGYMRSVLHTLAQCHSHRILHRDIKPGGLMPLAAHLQPARPPVLPCLCTHPPASGCLVYAAIAAAVAA